MTNHCDRRLVWTLIINAIDHLEQVARARELTNILWDINIRNSQSEQDWNRVEVLLESYEHRRDESLEAALSDLRDIVRIMSNSAQ